MQVFLFAAQAVAMAAVNLGLTMLQKAPPISGCLERALSAERRAALTSDAGLKYDYERLARDWRQVATSYEFNVRLERFIVAIDELKAAAIAEDPLASIPRHQKQASHARRG